MGLNTTRTYQYDSLGNLIREEQDGCVEYKYNGFALDESTKCGTIPNSIGTSFWEYTYDGRGNLVSNDKYTRTTSGMAWQNEETYVYDETNHMVDGKNELGERSLYTYNGLGLRVGRELIMKDNTHGYTDFHDQTPSVETGIDKPEVVKESYVIDYTSPTFQTLVMEEEGGFDYRWVYGLDKLSVKITSEGTNWWGQNVKEDILKDYLHQDRLGSTTNLTDKFGRMVGRADYNEWGEVTYKEALSITSSYRRIYPQLNYTGHDWDDVLEMYYAKARFYDPDAKRFVEIDPVKGSVTDPLSLVSYLYCVDNPLRWVDPLGLRPVKDDPRESFTTKTNLPKPKVPRPTAEVQKLTNNEKKHEQNQKVPKPTPRSAVDFQKLTNSEHKHRQNQETAKQPDPKQTLNEAKQNVALSTLGERDNIVLQHPSYPTEVNDVTQVLNINGSLVGTTPLLPYQIRMNTYSMNPDGTYQGYNSNFSCMALSTWHDLGKGYRYRVDPPAVSSEPPHIHIEAPDGKEWKQRADGAPYEENHRTTKSGDPPNWIRKLLKKDKDNNDNNKKGGGTGGPGWDWDGNKAKYEQKEKEKGKDNGHKATIDGEAVALGIGGIGLGYAAYRVVRLLPSLLPPLTPTLIPNLVAP